jgi:hypothetical protein
VGDLAVAAQAPGRKITALTAWHYLSLAFLLLAALRMLTLVLATPVLGYANQYDMMRSSACLDLWPGSAMDDVSADLRAQATPWAPQPIYQRVQADRANCYWSSDVALAQLALLTHRLFGGGADVDLRWIGVSKVGVLLIFAGWLSGLLWASPKALALNSAVLAVVLADPFVMLYANTLYTEFGAVMGAYLCVVAATCLLLTQHAKSASSAFVLGIVLLGCARVPHAPLAALLAIMVLLSLWRRQRRFPKALAASLLCALALASAVAVRNQHSLPGVSQANAMNTLFFTVLPSAQDAQHFARALALPERCGELAFASWYVRRGVDLARDCPEAFTFSRAKLALALLRHPGTGLNVLANAFAQSRGWRLLYVGEVAGATRARAPFLSVAEIAPLLPYPLYVLSASLLLTLSLGALLSPSLNPALRLCVALTTALFVLPLLISLLGDGYTELPRHAHLSTLAFAVLALLAPILFWQLTRKVVLVTVVSAIFATALLCTRSSAIASWEHPLMAQSKETFELRGWVIDPFGIKEISVSAPNQAPQILRLQQGPDVASVFQGYPNSAGGYVNASIQLGAPYSEIRVLNRLGVVTVVDRIWLKAATSVP